MGVWLGMVWLGPGSINSPVSGLGWLGQLFGGLGWVWVDDMDPRTTLIQRVLLSDSHCPVVLSNVLLVLLSN